MEVCGIPISPCYYKLIHEHVALYGCNDIYFCSIKHRVSFLFWQLLVAYFLSILIARRSGWCCITAISKWWTAKIRITNVAVFSKCDELALYSQCRVRQIVVCK